MIIHCNFPGCTSFKPKTVPQSLHASNNYNVHYYNCHKGNPCSKDEENQYDAANPIAKGKAPFFQTPATEQSGDDRYLDLLLIVTKTTSPSPSSISQKPEH